MHFYNEIDPFTAAWLRELIKAGELPDGCKAALAPLVDVFG